MIGLRLFLVKRALRKIQQKAQYHNLQAARRGFTKKVRAFNKPLAGFTYESDEIAGMKSEWIYYNKWVNPAKVILYFHGGGYATGGIETHRAFCSQLCKYSGAKLLLIEYRLSPENKYPAPIEDAVKAFQYLLNNGFNAENICFAGDSAGGGIAIGSIAYLRDNNMPIPASSVVFSPWLDLSASGNSHQNNSAIDPMLIYDGLVFWANEYLGSASVDAAYASPIFHTLEKFPPLLIQVGSDELLLDDSTRLAQKAKAQNVNVTLHIFEKHFHVFQTFWRILPQAKKANKEAGAFIAKHLKIAPKLDK